MSLIQLPSERWINPRFIVSVQTDVYGVQIETIGGNFILIPTDERDRLKIATKLADQVNQAMLEDSEIRG